MKKIIIVDDNRNFREVIRAVVKNHFPECIIMEFTEATQVVNELSNIGDDFDILLLDGDLGFGGHGSDVLQILTQDQIKKTITCSGNDTFIQECKEKGILNSIDKGFEEIRISKIGDYVLEIFKKV